MGSAHIKTNPDVYQQVPHRDQQLLFKDQQLPYEDQQLHYEDQSLGDTWSAENTPSSQSDMSMSSQCSSGYYSDSSCGNPVSLKNSELSHPKNTHKLLLNKEKKLPPAAAVATSHSSIQGELTVSTGSYKNTPTHSGFQNHSKSSKSSNTRTSRIPKPTIMSGLLSAGKSTSKLYTSYSCHLPTAHH